ncbi:MAG: hypothetical protein J1G04_04985 [Clostridiales bacterium]|nr:hypothetical protein [Clostridiales bacterium]
MELYYEQNLVNNNIDERIRKTKTFTIAKTICIIVALSVLMTSAMLVTNENFAMLLGILIAIAVPFIIAAIILGRINKRNNTEYDYTLDDEYLKITEVYFRSQRKVKHTIRLRTIESVGAFDSEGYKKADLAAQKKILALVNYDDEKAVLYILYNTDKGKRLIFLEPDRGLIIALKRAVSAVMVFDKSVADVEKYLNEKEILEQSAEDDEDDVEQVLMEDDSEAISNLDEVEDDSESNTYKEDTAQ